MPECDWIEDIGKQAYEMAVFGDGVFTHRTPEQRISEIARIIRAAHSRHCHPLDAALAEHIVEGIYCCVDDTEDIPLWLPSREALKDLILRVRDGAGGEEGERTAATNLKATKGESDGTGA